MVGTMSLYLIEKFSISCQFQEVAFVLPFSLIQPFSMLTVLMVHIKRDFIQNIMAFLGITDPESVTVYFEFCISNQADFLNKEWIATSIVVTCICVQLVITKRIWDGKMCIKETTNDTNCHTKKCFEFSMQQSFLERILFPHMEDSAIKSKIIERGMLNGEKSVNVYACATMWHETDSEMRGFLKSIFAMHEFVSERLVQYFLYILLAR